MVSLALLVLLGLGLAARFSWQLGIENPAQVHLWAGLLISLFSLLLYVLPYFYLIGLVGQIRDIGADDEASHRVVHHAVTLKAALLLPAILVTLAALLSPVLGVLENGGKVPDHTHLVASLLYLLAHFFFWAKSLYSIRMTRELFYAQKLES